MRDFFKYPRRSFEAHRTALTIGFMTLREGIFRENGLFVVVLTDPRMAMWVYLLVGYGAPIEKIVVLTPDEELGAEFFMGRGSFPALRVIIGDPLETVMEFRQQVRFLVFGSTRDSIVPDLPLVRRFSEITLSTNGLMILDYVSTFMYVTPPPGQDEPDETTNPYERFTQIAREFDPQKPDGPDNSYNTLMLAAGQENIKLLYEHLDQASPRIGFVATNVLMSFDVLESGLFIPFALTTVSARRISLSKSVKAFRALRDTTRRMDFPVQVIPMRHDQVTMECLPTSEGDRRIMRMQLGLHPDERGVDDQLPPIHQ